MPYGKNDFFIQMILYNSILETLIKKIEMIRHLWNQKHYIVIGIAKKKKQKLCVVNVPMCDNEWFTNWLINFYVSFTLTTIWSFFTTSSNHKKQKQKNYPNQNSIEQYKAQVNVGDCQGPER